jgi:hypothetical protein
VISGAPLTLDAVLKRCCIAAALALLFSLLTGPFWAALMGVIALYALLVFRG